MNNREYHGMDWEKKERNPGDTGYEGGRLLSGAWNNVYTYRNL